MWEDEQNKNGGKFIIRLNKGYANKFWEELVRFRCNQRLWDLLETTWIQTQKMTLLELLFLKSKKKGL